MQEKERERKGRNGKITKVAGCSPIREGVLLIRPDTTLADVRKFGEECQRRWGHHSSPDLPAQGRGALAERSAGSGRQGEFQSRRKMVQAKLPCPYRFRLDEPHDTGKSRKLNDEDMTENAESGIRHTSDGAWGSQRLLQARNIRNVTTLSLGSRRRK